MFVKIKERKRRQYLGFLSFKGDESLNLLKFSLLFSMLLCQIFGLLWMRASFAIGGCCNLWLSHAGIWILLPIREPKLLLSTWIWDLKENFKFILKTLRKWRRGNDWRFENEWLRTHKLYITIYQWLSSQVKCSLFTERKKRVLVQFLLFIYNNKILMKFF